MKDLKTTCVFARVVFASLVVLHFSAVARSSPRSQDHTATPVRPVVVVTKVVGEAGEQFITSREVRISDAIDQVVDGRPREASDTYQILKGTEKTFPAQVTKVLDEWVIVLEAKALSTSPPQKTEVARITKQVQERWGSVKDWVELEVSADEVREAIERKLTARELERLKANPQAEPTSDEEAQAYYNKNRLKFGQLTFAETKASIKTYLMKVQAEKRLAEWRDILRRKYKVRNFISG